MGYISNTVNNVRRFFAGDKEKVAYNIAKSSTRSPLSGHGPSQGLGNTFGYDALTNYMQMEDDIISKYADFESMNEGEIIASALDIYGDDSTASNLQLKRSVWVTSSDHRIQKILDDLFQKTLRIDEEIWEIARTLCMYGNCLTGDAKVLTTSGEIPIKDIVPGQIVYIHTLWGAKSAPVLNTIKSGTKKVYLLKTQTKEIKSSANHPFLKFGTVQDGRHPMGPKYERLEHLKVGDLIVVSKVTGPLEISSISYHDEPICSIEYIGEEDTYDLTIGAPEHNFIANGIVVHNSYEEILITADGVRGLNYMPVPTVRRVEGQRGELFGFVQDFRGKFGFNPQDLESLLQTRQDNINEPDLVDQYGSTQNNNPTVALEPFEIAHFRMKGSYRKSVYGSSVLEPARSIWRRMCLLEDAAMIYRLERAPERFAIYVDVGDIPAGEVLPYLKKVRQDNQKKKYIDPTSNKMNLKYEALAPLDNFYIPIRKGIEGAKVQTLTSPSWQSMEDLTWFQDKLFAAIKIPKAFLGQAEGAVRTSLASTDVRFCRTIMRVQRELINGLEKICRVHLAALGIDPGAVDFEVQMATPSSILELGQLEVRNAQAAFAAAMRANVSQYWILSKVFGMADGEIQGIMKQQEDEMTRNFMIQTKAQVQAQALMPQPPPMDPAQMAAMQAQQGAQPGQAPAQGQPPAQQPAQPGQPPMFSSSMLHLPFMPITEQELMNGSRRDEKQMENKMDEILRNNSGLKKTLSNLQGLIHDMKSRGLYKNE